MTRQMTTSHYNPVDRLEANEELFAITLCHQSPKRKRGVFDRSMVGRRLAAVAGARGSDGPLNSIHQLLTTEN